MEVKIGKKTEKSHEKMKKNMKNHGNSEKKPCEKA